MSNIMLTYRCNLHCSYCFANEFVNKDNTTITVRNFRKAVDFLTRNGKAHIGLIGGEPTLHPVFQLFLEMLIANDKVSGFTVYTNGLLIDRFVRQMAHSKAGALVNCNSPLVIGENAYETLKKNLDSMILEHYMNDKIFLGINLYSDDMDYSYIMELLQRYNKRRLRISLSVPDFSKCGEINVLDYFKSHKQFLLRFFQDMDRIHVMPHYDCNYPPACIWTDEEKEWLDAFVARYPGISTNLTCYDSRCNPTVDILPNLQAVRCFGMSDFLKVPIEEFKNDQDIARFFTNEIDFNAYRLSACEDCKTCYEKKTMNCVAGCMGFKAARIHRCNEVLEQI